MKYTHKRKKNQSGETLVEVLIAFSIMVTSLLAIIGIYTSLSKISYSNTPRIQAMMLAEEGIEAVRFLRDNSWSKNITHLPLSPTVFYLNWSGSTWSTSSVPVVIDNTFYRKITIAPAYRDGNFNLATTGTVDANTYLVTVNVSWFDRNATSTRTLQSYVFNTFNN